MVGSVVPGVFTSPLPVAADPASDYAAAVAADNPIAYYGLGTADSGSQMTDSSGNARHGMLTGSPTHIDGIVSGDQAIEFTPAQYGTVGGTQGAIPIIADKGTLLICIV